MSDVNGSSQPPVPSKKQRRPQPKLVVPEAVGGIQVNFCKNPICSNFNVPSEGARKLGSRPRATAAKDPAGTLRYKTSGGNTPCIQCQSCGECPPIKSNSSIKKGLDRIAAYIVAQPEPLCCPNVDCENHTDKIPVSPEDYRKFGQTAIGSPRWQCKRCGVTFSRPMKSTHRQKKSHKNAEIFRDLMNKTPLKGVARKNRISMKALYDKIDFIHDQCVAFAAHRESELPELKKRWMEISVDRQEHVINWFNTGDKRNIRVHAIASVDNRSGYVFGAHINYDGEKKRPKGSVIKKSPAMRLGLAKGTVTEEDILYFMPKQ